MASASETAGVQASASIEGSGETSGAHVPVEVGADEVTTDSADLITRDDLTKIRRKSESRDVAQEVGKLLQEVLTQLRQDPSPPNYLVTESVLGDPCDVETSDETAQSPVETPMIPEVRKVNFEHFKNQFHENDGRHIIEALVAGSMLPQAVREEGLKRQKRGLRTFSTQEPTLTTFPVTTSNGTIRRVRIRSKSILYYLSRLAGTPTPFDGTRTFQYPFVPLLYFQEDMRHILNLLEEKWTPSTRAFSQADVDATNPVQDDPLPPEFHKEDTKEEPAETDCDTPGSGSGSGGRTRITLDSGFDTPFTLQEFRSYIAFVDTDLSPLAHKYRDTSQQSVPFEDLWLLFNPGDYVSATIGSKTLLRRNNVAGGESHHVEVAKTKPYQGLWRLYGVTLPFISPGFRPSPQSPQTFELTEVEFDEEREGINCFRLHCYYIDFDGFAWRPVTKTFCIPPFEGTKSIDSLPACPLRYFKNAADIKADLITRGKKVMNCITDRHLQYTGWSLVHDPTGRPLRDFARGMNREPPLCEPKHIDSPCIIDFEETLDANPDWSPIFRPPDFHMGRWMAMIDDFEIMRWSNYSRTEYKSQEIDAVQSLLGIDMIQRKKAIEEDRFLASVKRRRFGGSADQAGPIAPLRDEDLVLLPKRVFAYALRERCLLPLDVEHISPIPVQENAFEQLKIPRTTKDLIRSVVIEHFEKKKLEQGMDSGEAVLMTQDSIGGKGKGLTFLLHGVPGVGKTATAEAVALEHRRPLFILTPGDVGTDSWGLANTLRRYFRLASRWDCILLLDEADTFLSQRSKYDVKRNALVSVFLQVLEYYNGILFLTTNRVGQLDEAFQSRIHLTLYYPSLDQKQTEQIFKVNLQKLRDTDAIRRKRNGMPALQMDEEKILDFARRPFANANNPSSRNRSFSQWNGRQIRNAFHLASSLAYRSMAEELERSLEQGRAVGKQSRCSVILDNNQFQKVADTMQAFNEYFTETRGFSDADLAFLAGDRADFWQDMTSRPPNHTQERPERYQRPYSSWNEGDRYGPSEYERQVSGPERGLHASGGSAPYGQRASFQPMNPYAVRPDIQAESSSLRQDFPSRARNTAFEDVGDNPRGRQQAGLREQALPAARSLDEFRHEHGYQHLDRRGEPHGRSDDSRGGPYAHGRTGPWESNNDDGDEYT